MVRKTNFLSISVLVSEIVKFWLKREILNEFPPKCFNTTEKHSLAVCDPIWGEKQFLLIFVPFYWFDQNNLFKQIQIFLRICIFSNMVRKTNFLSISVLVLRESLFWPKREVLCEFPPKCFKTTERHSLAVCGSLCGGKRFLLIFIPFYWFNQKHFFKLIQISSGFSPFKHGKKNRLSEYFSARFWDSQILTKKRNSQWISSKMLQYDRKT